MRHVALLRGINVGGNRKLPMAELRALAEALELENPRTYVASGNLVFGSSLKREALETKLEGAIAEHFGFAVDVIVRSAAEWAAYRAANPFPKESERAPVRVLVWAMRQPLPDSGLDQLLRRASADEKVVRTASGDIYMWFGGADIDASRLPAGFGLKALGAVGTNRNWNTVMKITTVLDEMEAAR